ncbi:MAG: YbaN family protein [archaeon]
MSKNEVSKPRKLLYLVVGFVSLVLGLIGIPLPILPTTPFILLSAWCFYRSSPKFHEWLINHPRLGPIVDEYADKEGMSRNSKIKALAMTWIAVIVTTVFALDSLHPRLLVITLAIIGTFFILRIKTRE